MIGFDRKGQEALPAGAPLEMVFVVGNSRSGTTLMSRILGGHPSIFTFHELHFFEELWDPGQRAPSLNFAQANNLFARLLAIQRQGYFQRANHSGYLPEARAACETGETSFRGIEVFQRFLQYEAAKHGCSIACDHTPRNVYYIEDILESFPGAFIVHMVRDPRDVLLSQKNKWRRRSLGGGNIPRREAIRSWVNYHPITISLLWRSGLLAGSHWEGHPRVITIQFEHLLASPDDQIHALCEGIGIEFQTEMLAVPQIGSSLGQDRPSQIGINHDVVQRWRQGGLQPVEILLSQRINQGIMGAFGYTPEPVSASILAVVWLTITWFFKAGLALIFNIRRVRNPLRAWRRRFGS